VAQPSGYTEPLLHAYQATMKAEPSGWGACAPAGSAGSISARVSTSLLPWT